MFPIEFPVSVNGVSAVFYAIHHCTVVGTLNIYFLMIYVWPFHLLVKSSLCVGDLLRHHTLRGDLHWVTCLIRGNVILSSSVKQDGWLRKHVCAFLESVNIWSGDASQPPFRVEISPKVIKLLCFIGVCLFFSNFHRFLDVLKLDFSFPCVFA